jgi:hypothetical protein
MGPLDPYGLSEAHVRELLERALGRSASSTSFYWESDELEEALDVIVDAIAKVIAANNKAMTDAIKNRGLHDMRF